MMFDSVEWGTSAVFSVAWLVTRCCVTWVGCVRPHQYNYRSEVFWPAVCNDWWCWEGRCKSLGDVNNLLLVVGDVVD